MIEEIHPMRVDGSSNALLRIDGSRDGVVDATQLFGGLGLHFPDGSEGRKI